MLFEKNVISTTIIVIITDAIYHSATETIEDSQTSIVRIRDVYWVEPAWRTE